MRWLCILALATSCFASQIVFHVNAENPIASDSNAGTEGAPFLTLSKAKAAVRTAIGNCSGVTAPVIVYVHGKQYPNVTWYSTSALSFSGAGSPNDSGCSTAFPTVYRVPAGEMVGLSGGRDIHSFMICANDPATPIAGDVCHATPTSPNLSTFMQLFVATPANVIAGTARRWRPRIGSNDTTSTPLRIFGDASGGTLACGAPPCFDRFQYTTGDPIVSFLNFNNGGGTCNVTTGTGAFPSGDILVFDNMRFTEGIARICDMDLVNHNIKMTGSVFPDISYNGWYAGHRYWIEGALTGADIPTSLCQGCWYLDRRATPFTLYYKVQSGENPHNDPIIVPQTSPPIITFTRVSNVKMYGFIIAHDNTVVSAAGYAPQANLWNLQPNEWFQCLNCTNVDWIGTTITETVGLGIQYTTDATVSSGLNNNELLTSVCYDAGAGCWYLGRFQPSLSDTDANVVSETILRNNKAIGTGRFYTGEAVANILMSHDVTVAHNDFSYTYGTGINICTGTAAKCHGGDSSSGNQRQIISKNLIHHIGQGYMSDSATGCIHVQNYQAQGVIAEGNTCHDTVGSQYFDSAATHPGFGGIAWYFDDPSAYTLTINNLAYRGTDNCWQDTSGPADPFSAPLVLNNICSRFRLGMFHSANPASIGPNGQPVTQSIAIHNYLEFDYRDTSTPAFNIQKECGPPTNGTLTQFGQLYATNLYYNATTDANTIPLWLKTNTSCVVTGTYTFAQFQALPNDIGSVIPAFGSHPFVDSTYPADNFTLAGAAQVGFVPFSLTQSGLDTTNQPHMPATVPDTRIIAPQNPLVDY